MPLALESTKDPDRTVGISSSEVVDTNDGGVRALAYKHFGQPVGFYPDHDLAKRDRRNVRDGHYYLWLKLRILTRTNGPFPTAYPKPPHDPDGSRQRSRDLAVNLLLDLLSNEPPKAYAADLFAALKSVGNVPLCAMRVRRAGDEDGTPLEPSSPSRPCHCAFESAPPGTTPRGCVPCATDDDCAAVGEGKACNYYFCE
jgi:hypothetical protein